MQGMSDNVPHSSTGSAALELHAGGVMTWEFWGHGASYAAPEVFSAWECLPEQAKVMLAKIAA